MSKQTTKKVKGWTCLYEGKPYKPLFWDYGVLEKLPEGEGYDSDFQFVPCTITYQVPRPTPKKKIKSTRRRA